MPSADLPSWRVREPLRVGDVEVRPASNEIVAGGTIVRIKPRLMDLLLRLAAAPGEVVPRDLLLADAWPRRIVNDEVLSRAIADLRAALGDDAREPRYIETLPKAGYRLLTPVTRAAPVAADAAAPDAAAPDAVTPVARPRAAFRLRPALAALVAIGVVAAVAIALQAAWRGADDADGDVARLVRQLAHAEPFSSGPDLEVAPRFSPDGSKVAFASGRGTRSQIEVRDVATGERLTLGDPQEASLSPTFFPGGRRIAFFRATPAGDCGIVAHDLTSGAQQQLLDCTRRPRSRFDLAPDGATLVYAGNVREGFPAALVLRTLATGEERVLTAPVPDAGDDLLPRFSPDGLRIAFFRGTQSHRELWLVEAKAGGTCTAGGECGAGSERSVRGPRGLAYGAAWLGNAGPLLVAADWFGLRSLNVIDPATGHAQPVGARGARSPDVDRHGNIVFENAVYSANLFLVGVNDPAGPPRELWPSTRYTNQPEFSPDGTRVAFISNRDGAAGVYVAPIGGEPARLAVTDEHVYMRPHWAADGRAVYAIRVSRRADGGRSQHAVRIDVDTRSTEVLAALGSEVFDLRPAGDGAGWIVGEVTGNAARLMRTTSLDAPPTRLPLPVAAEYQVAGGRIAMLQPALDGLTLCELATLKCEPLALPIGDASRFDWLLTRDAVYYRPAGSSELVRFDLARRGVSWSRDFGPTATGLAIASAPDGASLIVAREAPLAIDLMLAPRRMR